MDADVTAFIGSLSSDNRRVVSAIRAVVRRTIPRATESIIWGSLSYHRPEIGGRVKGAVCLIVAKQGKVRLDFIHGVRLADPSCLLQGRGVSKRSVPIETVADAERPAVAALIREAAAMDPTQWSESTTGARRPSGSKAKAVRDRREGSG